MLITIYSLLITLYTTPMDNKKYIQIVVLVALAGLALFVIKRQPKTMTQQATDFASCEAAGGQIQQSEPLQCTINGKTFTEILNPEPEVVIDKPQFGDLVSSPLTVSGKAKGFWFFEASMPVTLKDDQGNVLIQAPATALSDWMTSDYVPFSVTLDFNPGDAQYGVLIISKDNPSGLPENDASVAIPVRFK